MRIIPRPRLLRLIEQFQQSDHPLIVICAPAGYGKSVLLSQIALQIAETPDPPVLIDNYTPGTPLPTNKRVIIATRTDPDLHGLRITADDLRFTRDEITEFLRLYGMRDDLLDPLEQRTEGWAAGLHLARNIARRDGSVSPLMCSGTHRYVSDYFTSEVFAQQPPHIQHFLVQTSILDELDPDLCGAVTRTAHASALLNRIRRDNLFLSESGTRFHPLFAEYLRARLERPEPLHRLAAVWYVQRGKLVQAVPHLIAAQQHESVMRIITQVAFDPASGIDDHTLRDWLGALPDLSPELRLMYAGLLLRVGNVGSAAEHLRHVQTEYGDVQSTVAGALAHLGGDVRASAEHFRHALDTSPNPALRHAVELNIADARRTLGELPFARFGYADIVVRQHGDPHKRAVIALCQRGFLHLAQEQIRQAASMFNEALGIAPNDPLVHIGLAHTHLEQHQLALAERHAAHDPVLSREALAAVYHASGHIDQALQQLAGIEFSDPAFSRYEAQIAMQKAMLYLRKGDTARAISWALCSGLDADDTPDMPHLAEYMGLARVLLAQRRTEKAVSLLERLQALTVQTGQHVIRVQILLALAYQQHSSVPDAITMLEKALRRAEPEGIISRFVQEGEPMAVLLNKVLRSRARTGSLHDYTKRLLALIEPHSRHESSQDEDFLEAFSPRELEILSLISEGLPNGAIARELAINESTVKTHINNLYSKLGVHSRTLALRRARELDLL